MAEPRAIVPEKGIRPGLNSTGSDIAENVAVAMAAGGTEDPTEIELPGAGAKIYGIVKSGSVVQGGANPGIVDGEIGDIQVEGRAVCLVGAGGVTNGDQVAVTATGAVVLAATGNIVVGKAMITAADTEYTEVELVGAAQSIVAL